MDRLEAVQQILFASGRDHPSQLDTGGTSDAAIAETVLDRTELEVQSRTWNYNRLPKVTINPDNDSNLTVPVGTIYCRPLKRSNRFAQRGTKIYDLLEQTYTITEPHEFEVVLRLSWDCIPIRVRMYIAAEASYRFASNRALWLHSNRRNTHGPVALQQLMEHAAKTEAEARRFDTETNQLSMLDRVDVVAFDGGRATLLGAALSTNYGV